MSDRYVKDGKVAILYSPRYGAGWSTWSDDPRMVFCPRLAEAVDKEASLEELEKIAAEEFPNEYHGGLKELCIEWVAPGTRFEISEYDGAESVRIFDDVYYLIA